MYQSRPRGWMRHIDFILLDLAVTEAAFLLAYFARQGDWLLFRAEPYRTLALLLLMFNVVRSLLFEDYSGILRRGYWQELLSVMRVVFFDAVVILVFLFAIKVTDNVSRIVVGLFALFCVILMYGERVLWKELLRSGKRHDQYHKSHLLVVTHSMVAEDAVTQILANSYSDYEVVGVILIDVKEREVGLIQNVPVVCLFDDAVRYMQGRWIDEVMLYLPSGVEAPEHFLAYCSEMGITTHLRLNMESTRLGMRTVEEFAGATVLTESLRIATPWQVFLKRVIDICGAIVGLLFTALFTIIIGPIIFFTDPGPIFFTQKRIGQNGRVFKIYKFRSMYKDAEKRKQELMEQNTMKGFMFKVDADPRILGSGPDGTRHGIGWFIRKTSIDEFPQFLNVLKGELSLVGTRPPLMDEWEQYERHHRARMSVRPGLTGLWQVSGRSDIKDFEEVIALDMEYINNWSIGEDIKIILKTVKVIFTGGGAQ